MLLPASKGGLSPYGTFWFFTAITLIGGVWAWCFIPETAGLSLEQMDHLFTLKWWRIGIWGRKEAERLVDVERERWATEKTGQTGEEVEYVAENERKV